MIQISFTTCPDCFGKKFKVKRKFSSLIIEKERCKTCAGRGFVHRSTLAKQQTKIHF